MLHGWGASLYMFRHALAMLPPRGFRAIAVDLRGYGLSDHPTARGRVLARRIPRRPRRAARRARDCDRVALMGQSMGGGLALHYALRRSRARYAPRADQSGGARADRLGVTLMRRRSATRDGRARRAARSALARRASSCGTSRTATRRCVTERDVDENWAPTQLPGFVHAVRAAIAEFDWRAVSTRRRRRRSRFRRS